MREGSREDTRVRGKLRTKLRTTPTYRTAKCVRIARRKVRISSARFTQMGFGSRLMMSRIRKKYQPFDSTKFQHILNKITKFPLGHTNDVRTFSRCGDFSARFVGPFAPGDGVHNGNFAGHVYTSFMDDTLMSMVKRSNSFEINYFKSI